jgi:endo-alpha-1,4-polygalactosaminidase (GH114 family)
VSKKQSQVTLKKKAGSSSEGLVAYIQICVVSSYKVLKVLKFNLEKVTKAREGGKV